MVLCCELLTGYVNCVGGGFVVSLTLLDNGFGVRFWFGLVIVLLYLTNVNKLTPQIKTDIGFFL